MIDPASFLTLPANLSPARVQPYVDAEGGDVDRGLRLYTWNVEVSSAFWGVLHAVEIALRNAMNVQLVAHFGQDEWWDAPKVNLTYVGRKMVNEAKDSAEKLAKRKSRAVVSGDVVASLNFGFWSSLTGKAGVFQYETQFWQPALVRAFPNLSSTKVAPVNRTLESIRLLRNRVAHHEPIFRRHLAADHQTLLSVLGWIDADMENYVAAHSRVLGVIGRRSACVNTGTSTSF